MLDEKKLGKNMRAFFGLLVGTVVIFGLFYWQYQHDLSTPIDPLDSNPVSFQIKKGETAREIAKNLAEKELIKSSFNFYTYVKYNDLAEKILAGRFQLKKSMTIKEIAASLTDPAQAQTIITIQEGLRARDIDSKLVELGLIENGAFLEKASNFDGWQYYDFLDRSAMEKLEIPVEGYLYPDTYFLNPADFEAHDLIYLAIDNFEQKTGDLRMWGLPKIKNRTFQEIITMASIVENEVFGFEDRKIVAGILWKRLDSGWRLDADATLLYTKEDRKITTADLESDSPYNTRKFAGLPPGPISNPSLESIDATMFPTATDYWFYLTTPDTGEVIYAKTNEEQNLNRAKYLQ